MTNRIEQHLARVAEVIRVRVDLLHAARAGSTSECAARGWLIEQLQTLADKERAHATRGENRRLGASRAPAPDLRRRPQDDEAFEAMDQDAP